jgi:hypothetical protein
LASDITQDFSRFDQGLQQEVPLREASDDFSGRERLEAKGEERLVRVRRQTGIGLRGGGVRPDGQAVHADLLVEQLLCGDGNRSGIRDHDEVVPSERCPALSDVG